MAALPLGVALLVIPASGAKALPVVATGSITVGFRATLTYPFCTGCSLAIAGSSAGELAGVDGNTAYEVSWPSNGANFAGTIYYTPSCSVGDIPGLTSIGPLSSITITNAVMTYGTQAAKPAQVTVTFGGAALPGGVEVETTVRQIDITGPASVTITMPESTGVIHLTPVTPVGACISGGTQQGFEMSGPLLALQP